MWAALFAYFPTKEALFLSVYEQLLGDWFTDLFRHLRLGGMHTPESLATTINTLLLERPDFARLLPLLATILEHNITPERALAHQTFLSRYLATAVPLLEAALPSRSPGGDAAHF